MKIDVVITTFNRKDDVVNAIESALDRHINKVIVVDDNSSDETVKILENTYRNNQRLKLICNPENGGVTKAKNIGFKHSKADWVIFLDSDDLLLTDQIDKAEKTLKDHKDKVIVFFRCIDQEDVFVGQSFGDDKFINITEYIEHTSYGEALTVFNKRLDDSLPYDEDLRGYEGLGCARSIKKYGSAVLSPIVLRRYDRSGEDRLSSSQNFLSRTNLLAKGHYRFYKTFIDDMTLRQKVGYIIKFFVYAILSNLTKPLQKHRTP